MPPQRRRTRAGAARRRQIIDTTIEVLARDGMGGTTFTSIAKEAGLSSPGLISYHFDDKDELLASAIGQVVDGCHEAISSALESAGDDPAAQLGAYIEAFVRFQDTHRAGVSAVWRLLSALTADQALGWSPKHTVPMLSRRPLTDVLRAGQASGAFRDFDAEIMSQTIHCAAESYREVYVADPAATPDAFVAELTETFLRATAAD